MGCGVAGQTKARNNVIAAGADALRDYSETDWRKWRVRMGLKNRPHFEIYTIARAKH